MFEQHFAAGDDGALAVIAGALPEGELLEKHRISEERHWSGPREARGIPRGLLQAPAERDRLGGGKSLVEELALEPGESDLELGLRLDRLDLERLVRREQHWFPSGFHISFTLLI